MVVMNCGKAFNFASHLRQSYWLLAQYSATFFIVASGTPCDLSVTVSLLGQRVALMRRRSSARSASEAENLKGRMAVWSAACLLFFSGARVWVMAVSFGRLLVDGGLSWADGAACNKTLL